LKGLNYSGLQLAKVLIRNKAIGAESCLCAVNHQFLAAPVSDSEGKHSVFIMQSDFFFNERNNILWFLDMAIGKQEYSFLSIAALSIECSVQWTKDVCASHVADHCIDGPLGFIETLVVVAK
jgi:hypothetical protein